MALNGGLDSMGRAIDRHDDGGIIDNKLHKGCNKERCLRKINVQNEIYLCVNEELMRKANQEKQQDMRM